MQSLYEWDFNGQKEEDLEAITKKTLKSLAADWNRLTLSGS